METSPWRSQASEYFTYCDGYNMEYSNSQMDLKK